jgi:molybdenum cofactor cytidylyltransferase
MISAIVLAAGTSSRMGSPKPLLMVGGRPLLEQVLDTVRNARVDEIIVVLGHEADRVRDRVSFDGARAIVNPAYMEGMSTSLRAGVRAADPRSDGFLIVLGDQPFVASATINTLINRRNGSHAKVLIPTYERRRGNPVLLDRSLSEDVQSITGDLGCRAIFGRHTRGILEVPVEDPGILVDLDTPEQIARAEEVVRTGRTIEGLVAMTEQARLVD